MILLRMLPLMEARLAALSREDLLHGDFAKLELPFELINYILPEVPKHDN